MRRVVLALVRVAVGLAFCFTGSAKFFEHEREVADFTRWGLPSPDTAVYLVGADAGPIPPAGRRAADLEAAVRDWLGRTPWGRIEPLSQICFGC